MSTPKLIIHNTFQPLTLQIPLNTRDEAVLFYLLVTGSEKDYKPLVHNASSFKQLEGTKYKGDPEWAVHDLYCATGPIYELLEQHLLNGEKGGHSTIMEGVSGQFAKEEPEPVTAPDSGQTTDQPTDAHGRPLPDLKEGDRVSITYTSEALVVSTYLCKMGFGGGHYLQNEDTGIPFFTAALWPRWCEQKIDHVEVLSRAGSASATPQDENPDHLIRP